MDLSCSAEETPSEMLLNVLHCSTTARTQHSKLEAQERHENPRSVLLLFDVLDLHAGRAAAGAQRQLPRDVRDVGAARLREETNGVKPTRLRALPATAAPLLCTGPQTSVLPSDRGKPTPGMGTRG